MYTPSGNANSVCVSDNALSGIENANEHHTTLDVCPEVTCPCWDADTLANLPELDGADPINPGCLDDYDLANFQAEYLGGPGLNVLAVWDAPDYYQQPRRCLVGVPNDSNPWVSYAVSVEDISHAEADTCADILRASKMVEHVFRNSALS